MNSRPQTAFPIPRSQPLHGRDVLATTVLQTCIRYQSRTKTCQFCAIGQSLAAGRTVERKTPSQLAEVAKAAVELDGVKHMVMTTGTPPGNDRGAAILAESAQAVKAVVKPADSGSVRTARRRCVVPAHEGRRRGCARACTLRRSRPPCVSGSCRAKRKSRSSATCPRSKRQSPVFGRGQVLDLYPRRPR